MFGNWPGVHTSFAARSRDDLGEGRKQQRTSDERKHDQRQHPPILIGAYQPCASCKSQARNDRESERHPEQQRKSAPAKWLIGARKNEREDRQDAGAQNREHATQECRNKDHHDLIRSPGDRNSRVVRLFQHSIATMGLQYHDPSSYVFSMRERGLSDRVSDPRGHQPVGHRRYP